MMSVAAALRGLGKDRNFNLHFLIKCESLYTLQKLKWLLHLSQIDSLIPTTTQSTTTSILNPFVFASRPFLSNQNCAPCFLITNLIDSHNSVSLFSLLSYVPIKPNETTMIQIYSLGYTSHFLLLIQIYQLCRQNRLTNKAEQIIFAKDIASSVWEITDSLNDNRKPYY